MSSNTKIGTEMSVGGRGRLFGWKRRRMGSKSPGRKSKYVTKRELPSLVMPIVNKRAELKHIFHEFKSATCDSTCAVYHLTNLDDGVNGSERVGENIMVAGIDMSGFFNSDEGTEATVARLIIFRANEAVPSTPAPSSILTTIGDNRTPVSLYNVDNHRIGIPGSNRASPAYTVYYDNILVLEDENSAASKKLFNVKIRLPKPLPCQFIGAEDTDEGPGQWYALYCSNVSAPSTTVQMNADARLYYTDV